MRTLILSPVDRRKILLGKNIAITFIALIFSIALLTLNAIVFRDLTPSGSSLCRREFHHVRGNQFDNRQLDFDSLSQAHALRKANERVRHGRDSFDPVDNRARRASVAATLVGYFTQSMLNEYLTLAGPGFGLTWPLFRDHQFPWTRTCETRDRDTRSGPRAVRRVNVLH